jgi:hypothetical protein
VETHNSTAPYRYFCSINLLIIMEHKSKFLLLAVLILVSFFVAKKFIYSNELPKNLSQFQAVFLSDGQVYFGHLEKNSRDYFLLSNVYYLKYGSSIQQKDKTGDDVASANLNLIQLGGEVHGPENSMYIAKDKILFIENLKDSSQVVKSMQKTGL